MKVFITGATGVLGKRVVRLLVQKGITVIALSHSRENTEQLLALGATPFDGNLFNLRDMIRGTRECDSIFHLASRIPKKEISSNAADWSENDRIRTEGTTVLLRAATFNRVRAFIQPSVTFLYGNKGGAEITTDTPIAARHLRMIASAAEMERIIRSQEKTEYVILRFGNFYSADSWNTQWLVDAIRHRKVPVVGSGKYYWNFISADDAADAVVYAWENFERLKNRTLNFTDFAPISSADWAVGLAELTDSKRPPFLPSILARLLLKKEVFALLTNSHRILRDPSLNGWHPKKKDFLIGMKEVIQGGQSTENRLVGQERSKYAIK